MCTGWYNRFLYLSHPVLGWLYVFSSFPPRPRPRPPPQKLLPLTSKPFELNLWYLAQRIYGSGEMYWVTFQWPWPKVTAVASISKNLLVCAIKWEPLIGSLTPSHGYYLIRFWKLFWNCDFWQIFCKNFGCVFSRSNTILAIPQEWLVPLMWNEKEVHWLDTEYYMWHLTSLMTFDLGCFKVKFRNSSISGIVGLIDVKWKGSELIWYWANCMTLPVDHTHDLYLGIAKSESEIALSQEWGGRLTMNEKDVSRHPIITMILSCVTMVGWADVPDSDRGDFRCRRAVDISSFVLFSISCSLAGYKKILPWYNFSWGHVNSYLLLAISKPKTDL